MLVSEINRAIRVLLCESFGNKQTDILKMKIKSK